jgi:hypothetical protein
MICWLHGDLVYYIQHNCVDTECSNLKRCSVCVCVCVCAVDEVSRACGRKEQCKEGANVEHSRSKGHRCCTSSSDMVQQSGIILQLPVLTRREIIIVGVSYTHYRPVPCICT